MVRGPRGSFVAMGTASLQVNRNRRRRAGGDSHFSYTLCIIAQPAPKSTGGKNEKMPRGLFAAPCPGPYCGLQQGKKRRRGFYLLYNKEVFWMRKAWLALIFVFSALLLALCLAAFWYGSHKEDSPAYILRD